MAHKNPIKPGRHQKNQLEAINSHQITYRFNTLWLFSLIKRF